MDQPPWYRMNDRVYVAVIFLCLVQYMVDMCTFWMDVCMVFRHILSADSERASHSTA